MSQFQSRFPAFLTSFMKPAVLWAFLASRLWVAGFVYMGHAQRLLLAAVEGGFAGVPNWWLNPWTAFDSQHFLNIALHGYSPQTAPFLPLYPMVLRLAGHDILFLSLWGIVVSNLAFLGMLGALHHLTRLESSVRSANLAVWILAFCPTSAIFSSVYTDALFGFCAVFAFLNARQARWVFAALWATLAALTRNVGLLVALAICVEWWQWRQSSKTNDFDKKASPLQEIASTKRPFPWVLLAPLLAFALFQIYLAQRFGGIAGVSSHEQYGRAPMWPWVPIVRDLSDIVSLQHFNMVAFLNVTAIVIALAFLCRRSFRRVSYVIVVAGVLLMQLSLGRTKSPYTNSSLRLLSTAFPIMQVLAIQMEKWSQRRLLMMMLATFYLMLNALMSYLFGCKLFVMG